MRVFAFCHPTPAARGSGLICKCRCLSADFKPAIVLRSTSNHGPSEEIKVRPGFVSSTRRIDGQGLTRRTHHARRDVSRTARTRARVKDLDQIQDDMKPENRPNYEVQPIDEDKPGLGQHVSCFPLIVESS